MDVNEAETVALQIQNDVTQEMEALQRSRRITLAVYLYYGFFFVGFSVCLVSLLMLYRDNWDRECDIGLKVWSLVWLARMLLQLIFNTMVASLRMRGGESSALRALKVITRLIYAFGFTWWLFGLDQLYFEPHCPDPTLARSVSQIMFWVTGTVYLIPFVIYTLICLCLPCIIYFMVRFAVRPADRQPTPPSLIQQLEVKTYADLIENLKRQYTVDSHEVDIQTTERQSLPGVTIQAMIDGVSNLLSRSSTSPPGGLGGSPGGTATDSLIASSSTLNPMQNLSSHSSSSSSSSYNYHNSNGSLSDQERSSPRSSASPYRQGESRSLFNSNGGRDRGLTTTMEDSLGGGGGGASNTSGLLTRQSISINRSCPICMVDLDDEDQVLIMPCDSRHFFHKACVEHWLETSQACPICRANIVNILTGTPSDPNASPIDQRDLEMQI